MADAIVIDVVQEVSRILTASDVVVEELTIYIINHGSTMKILVHYGFKLKIFISNNGFEVFKFPIA
jgi:hypothetical protein